MPSFEPVWKDGLFAGKVVFVTGGAGSICKRMTEAMVVLGADAAILGRRKDVTEKAAAEIAKLRRGARVIGISADVRDLKSLESAANQTVEQLSKIDFVIAGAAGNFLAAVNELSSNAFKTVMDIDVNGTYNTVKATMEHVKLNKGRYLFVSATLHYAGSIFQSHVSAAKAAIDAFMKCLALELGPLGVTVNCIAPGGTKGTEGIERLLPKERLEEMMRRTPLQRLAKISEMADGTVFLFSPAAKFITGQILVVDGGSSLNTNSFLSYPDSVLDSKKVFDSLKVAGRKKESAKL